MRIIPDFSYWVSWWIGLLTGAVGGVSLVALADGWNRLDLWLGLIFGILIGGGILALILWRLRAEKLTRLDL